MSSTTSSTLPSSKRKEPPSSSLEATNAAAKVTPAEKMKKKAPYEARIQQLKELRQAAGDDFVLYDVLPNDLLERIPGKLEELDVDEADELSPDKLKLAYEGLTEEQIEQHMHYMIVPKPLYELQSKYYKEILHADTRNGNDDSVGFVMLNTYSSWCMYPIIQKQLSAAVREVNKAMKATPKVPGIAAVAFWKTVAAVFACDGCDHWRLDTESPQECDKIAKRVSNLLKNLLWFSDQELGLVDPHSRKALLARLEMIKDDWKDIEWMSSTVTYKTAKNGQGMGRSLDTHDTASGPVNKKPRTLAPLVASAGGNNTNPVLTYLGGIHDKLPLRVKTQVQLKIASASNPNKYSQVIVSGSTCMKKLGQLCAYVTGHTDEFHHHSQKGKSLKGSSFEIQLNGNSLVLGDKALAKKAAANGLCHVLDKTVKIVQVFQGLLMGPTEGMVFDSDAARTLASTPGSVLWHANDKDRYEISVEGIMASKRAPGNRQPLPRLVTNDDVDDPRAVNGFGKSIHRSNRYIRGNRQGPSFIVPVGTSQAEISQMTDLGAADAMCSKDGIFGGGTFYSEICFTPEIIQSAGPPSVA